MRLAVIPARGGSKRIPRKNIKEFQGQPMILWSIQAALNSGCFDEVWVSTDDPEIANIAEENGAKVPFIRPEYLSDDFATTADVMQHAVGAFQQIHKQNPDFVCCLYATAPFVQAHDLMKGFERIQTREWDYVFSATNFAFPIQRAIKLGQSGQVEMFNPEFFNTRSQDLEEAWHDAGQFYWGTAEAWLNKKMIFSDLSSVIELSRYRVQDIDTLEDWERAELIAKILFEEKS